ncbi:protein rapunzel-like isoform X2 [Phyllopteryx taeniolatus]|uniref:protein rapunzel-like isoform X2 n=1 Tax=Phyllopteryx taeniolatus TaxID=161469 RepID=UPI002AD3D35A|nr:protein rapunzel-like isoform X2 [Phyllopteryx taeniolatus]
MSSSLEKVVAQKKEAIEAAMDMLERGAEVVASAVGELFPLCEAAAPVLRLALDNVQSKEVFYVKEQFLTVRNSLDLLSGQLEDIDCEIKKSRLDSQYFGAEENLRNQFRKYMDIIEAKPQFGEVKTKLFLEHFSRSGGEKNLFVLYHALMGSSGFGDSILDLVERYVSRNRRLLEDFCVRMKELLCLGLIALLGHSALTQNHQEEQDKIQEWSRKMDEIELRMKTTVRSCVDAFPEQAKLDAQHLLQEKQSHNLQETTQQVLDFLVKKYDWYQAPDGAQGRRPGSYGGGRTQGQRTRSGGCPGEADERVCGSRRQPPQGVGGRLEFPRRSSLLGEAQERCRVRTLRLKTLQSGVRNNHCPV